jgi:hypothetical protein
VRARRRLSLIAGMALSAAIIAAPAAHADNVPDIRQDCVIDDDNNNTGAAQSALARVLDTVDGLLGTGKGKGQDRRRADVDVDFDDSFNCSNFFIDSFKKKKDDHRMWFDDRDDHRKKDDHRKWFDDRDDHRKRFDDRDDDRKWFDDHDDHKFHHGHHGWHHGHHKFHHWGHR